MVAPYQVYATRVAQFEAGKEGYCLYTEQSSVDVVAYKEWASISFNEGVKWRKVIFWLTKKEIVCTWGIPADSKYFDEVVELTKTGECWSGYQL